MLNCNDKKTKSGHIQVVANLGEKRGRISAAVYSRSASRFAGGIGRYFLLLVRGHRRGFIREARDFGREGCCRSTSRHIRNSLGKAKANALCGSNGRTFPRVGKSSGFSLDGARGRQARMCKRRINSQARATRAGIAAVLESHLVIDDRELLLSM